MVGGTAGSGLLLMPQPTRRERLLRWARGQLRSREGFWVALLVVGTMAAVAEYDQVALVVFALCALLFAVGHFINNQRKIIETQHDLIQTQCQIIQSLRDLRRRLP